MLANNLSINKEVFSKEIESMTKMIRNLTDTSDSYRNHYE